MKRKKKYVILGSVVAFLVLVTGFCIVGASGDYGFCGRGSHPPFFRKAFRERMLSHMDDKMEELNLTEVQEKKYVQLKKSFKSDFEEMRSGRSGFMNEMRAVIDQKNPDMQKVAGLVKTRLNRIPDRVGSHLDELVDFYNILNEEQKAKVLDRMRERMANCEKWSERQD